MRRVVVVVVAVGLLVVPARASAHACSRPVEIPVGREGTVTVGVPAEFVPVDFVETRVPAGFEITRVPQTPGWTAEQDRGTVRWRGGVVEAFQCGYFSFRGKASRKGRLVLPITTRSTDGATQELTSTDPLAPDSAQLVYAGISAPRTDTSDSESSNSGSVVAALAAGVGLAGVAAWWVTRRRGAARAEAARQTSRASRTRTKKRRR